MTSPLTVSIQPSGQLTVDVGSRAELHCYVTGGNPGSGNSRTWLKDGHVIGPAGSTDQLVIPRVQREDAGMYQCLVRDEEESAQSIVQLILGGELFPKLYFLLCVDWGMQSVFSVVLCFLQLILQYFLPFLDATEVFP